MFSWWSLCQDWCQLPLTPFHWQPSMCVCVSLSFSRNVKWNVFVLCPIFRNPSATPQGANNLSRDPSLRSHNLNFLVQQIKTYYLVSFGPSPHLAFVIHIKSVVQCTQATGQLSFPCRIMISEHSIQMFRPQLRHTHTSDHACARRGSRWHWCPSRSTSSS